MHVKKTAFFMIALLKSRWLVDRCILDTIEILASFFVEFCGILYSACFQKLNYSEDPRLHYAGLPSPSSSSPVCPQAQDGSGSDL
jgi:hypothetical protein